MWWLSQFLFLSKIFHRHLSSVNIGTHSPSLLCETPFSTLHSKLNFSVKACVRVAAGIEMLHKAAPGAKVTSPTLYPQVLLWDCNPTPLIFPVHSSTILLSLALSAGNHFVGRRLFYICPGFYFLFKTSISKSLLGKRQCSSDTCDVPTAILKTLGKIDKVMSLTEIVSIFWTLVYSCGEGWFSEHKNA